MKQVTYWQKVLHSRIGQYEPKELHRHIEATAARIKLMLNTVSSSLQTVFVTFYVFLYSVRGADAGNGIRVFIPDIGMFIAGLVTWLLCRSLEKPPGKDILQHNTDFDMGNQVS